MSLIQALNMMMYIIEDQAHDDLGRGSRWWWFRWKRRQRHSFGNLKALPPSLMETGNRLWYDDDDDNATNSDDVPAFISHFISFHCTWEGVQCSFDLEDNEYGGGGESHDHDNEYDGYGRDSYDDKIRSWEWGERKRSRRRKEVESTS